MQLSLMLHAGKKAAKEAAPADEDANPDSPAAAPARRKRKGDLEIENQIAMAMQVLPESRYFEGCQATCVCPPAPA